MDENAIRTLLDGVQGNRVSVQEALNELRRLPFTDIDFAKLDHHRTLRNGFPEVVLCEGKRQEHVVAIMEKLCAAGGPVLGTRASVGMADAVRKAIPEVRYQELARALVYEPRPLP